MLFSMGLSTRDTSYEPRGLFYWFLFMYLFFLTEFLLLPYTQRWSHMLTFNWQRELIVKSDTEIFAAETSF